MKTTIKYHTTGHPEWAQSVTIDKGITTNEGAARAVCEILGDYGWFITPADIQITEVSKTTATRSDTLSEIGNALASVIDDIGKAPQSETVEKLVAIRNAVICAEILTRDEEAAAELAAMMDEDAEPIIEEGEPVAIVAGPPPEERDGEPLSDPADDPDEPAWAYTGEYSPWE